jgi:hypothetical protein
MIKTIKIVRVGQKTEIFFNKNWETERKKIFLYFLGPRLHIEKVLLLYASRKKSIDTVYHRR